MCWCVTPVRKSASRQLKFTARKTIRLRSSPSIRIATLQFVINFFVCCSLRSTCLWANGWNLPGHHSSIGSGRHVHINDHYYTVCTTGTVHGGYHGIFQYFRPVEVTPWLSVAKSAAVISIPSILQGTFPPLMEPLPRMHYHGISAPGCPLLATTDTRNLSTGAWSKEASGCVRISAIGTAAVAPPEFLRWIVGITCYHHFTDLWSRCRWVTSYLLRSALIAMVVTNQTADLKLFYVGAMFRAYRRALRRYLSEPLQ